MTGMKRIAAELRSRLEGSWLPVAVIGKLSQSEAPLCSNSLRFWGQVMPNLQRKPKPQSPHPNFVILRI